ncbi:MAG: response regulator [Candidatus Xenobiia bacterium LiM19]
MIKIIIIEDHEIIRESIELSVERQKDIIVAGKWDKAEDALLFLKDGECDVALVDNMLPGMDGVTFIRQALQLRPALKVIMISMYTHQSIVCQAFENGAYGFFPKDIPISELIEGIRTVFRGESVISPKLTRKLMEYKSTRGSVNGENSIVSGEQKIILTMAAKGMGNKEISDKMGCSISNIKHRFSDILKVLEARDRTHAVVKAIKTGLIELGPEVMGCEDSGALSQNP